MGPYEAATPCVGGASVLPMEGEVEAAGGQGGSISCWSLCVLCCCASSWTVLLATGLVEIDGGKVTNKQNFAPL
jgi:hypothetical protein